MRDLAPLAVIGLLFTLFCLAFSSGTPYRRSGILLHQRGLDGGPAKVQDVGAPDERQHANYIANLVSGKGIPKFEPGDPDLYESYQSHQPPLYYLIGAGWCKVFGIDPKAPDSGNGIRFLNTLVGLGTILGLGFGGKWAFGEWKYGWAPACLALVPMNVALHSAVSNDPLLILLCTWVMAIIGLSLKTGLSIKLALLIAVLTGLALLTKTTALALLPCVVLAVWISRKQVDDRPRPLAALTAIGLPLLIAIPWWVRNMALYGDPLALKAFQAAFVGSPHASDFISALGPTAYWLQMVAWWTFRSAVGVFGYMDIFMFEALNMNKSGSIYLAILVLALVPLGAGLVGMIRSKDEPAPSKGTKVVWGAFTVLVFILFVRFNMQYFQGQARYLYPALGPVAWCFGLGACMIAKSKDKWAWVILVLALSALDFVAYNEIVAGFTRRVAIY